MEVRKIKVGDLEIVYNVYKNGTEGTGYTSFGRCCKDLFWGVGFNLSKGENDIEEDVAFILKQIKEVLCKYKGREEIFRNTNWKHYVNEFVQIGKLHAAKRDSKFSTFNTSVNMPCPV